MSNSPLPPTAPIVRNPQSKSREFTMKSQQAMVDTYSWECCLNCDHWTKNRVERVKDETKYSGWREENRGPICMKYEMLPPPEVQLIGCETYEPSIPF